MTHWAMVVDLRKCVGCGTCATVCAQVNQVPPGLAWRHIYEKYLGEKAAGERFFVPTACMHCGNPPCERVCPTGATKQREDGLIYIDYIKCMGCGACIAACAYKARSIAESERLRVNESGNPGSMVIESGNHIGICTKCDLCRDRLDNGLRKGLKPGVDSEATPVCVNYCISEALQFGDLGDPESEVSRIIRENNVVRLGEELCTEPSVYYVLEKSC